MRGVDLGAPQRIGMRPQHRLRARRGAGGILHAAGRERIGRAARPVGAVAEQRFETVAARRGLAGRGRCTGIVRDHGNPAQVLAVRGDHLGISGLGDGGDRAAMARKIFHLRGRRAGVGGDRDRAEFDAGEPGQHRLDAVVQMNQHELARLDAAPAKAGGERADAVVKFAIAPCPRRRIERRPDQERMIAADFGAHPAAATARRALRMVRRCPAVLANSHGSSRAALDGRLVVLVFAWAVVLPPDRAVGKSAIADSHRASWPGLTTYCSADPQPGHDDLHDGVVLAPPHTTKSRSGCRRDRGNRPSAACRGRPVCRPGLPRSQRPLAFRCATTSSGVLEVRKHRSSLPAVSWSAVNHSTLSASLRPHVDLLVAEHQRGPRRLAVARIEHLDLHAEDLAVPLGRARHVG